MMGYLSMSGSSVMIVARLEFSTAILARDERAVIKYVSDVSSLVGGYSITITVIIIHYII
ncbi:MAG: hypothetical protein V8R91_16505 [Butyricimonas faecihominis]